MAAEQTENVITPPVCAEELSKLYNAMMAKMQSKQRTRTRYEDQEAEYSSVTLKDLEKMYMVWWNKCGDGSGFPDMSTKQRRGPPAHVRAS